MIVKTHDRQMTFFRAIHPGTHPDFLSSSACGFTCLLHVYPAPPGDHQAPCLAVCHVNAISSSPGQWLGDPDRDRDIPGGTSPGVSSCSGSPVFFRPGARLRDGAGWRYK